MAFRAQLDEVDSDDLLDAPDEPPIVSSGKVTIARGGVNRTVVQVELAPQAFQELEAAGGQIEVQVVVDDKLA